MPGSSPDRSLKPVLRLTGRRARSDTCLLVRRQSSPSQVARTLSHRLRAPLFLLSKLGATAPVHTIILSDGLVAIIVEWTAAIADSVFALASGMGVKLPNPVLLKALPYAGKHHLVPVLADQRDCFPPRGLRLVHARHSGFVPQEPAKVNI